MVLKNGYLKLLMNQFTSFFPFLQACLSMVIQQSNFQENHVKNEQPLVLQKLSTNKFQKVDAPEEQRDMKDNDENGIETIEVTYISPNNSQKVDTTEQHRDREDNDENGIETIEVNVDTKNEITTACKRIIGVI